jgi:hypothetical protein
METTSDPTKPIVIPAGGQPSWRSRKLQLKKTLAHKDNFRELLRVWADPKGSKNLAQVSAWVRLYKRGPV